MTKPQKPPNGPKAQAFQVQGQRHAALGWSSCIGFMGNGKKVPTRFALVALSSFVDPTFDFVRTGTPRTIQHLRLHGIGEETSVAYISQINNTEFFKTGITEVEEFGYHMRR
jgi:hypothetical protein